MKIRHFLLSPRGRLTALFALALLLILTGLTGLRFGTLELSFAEIFRTLCCKREGIPYQILWNIRFPRILLGMAVGGALAVSGTILQGVMRNPLAGPGIIGISSGGGLAAVLLLLAVPRFSPYLVPGAFLGALGTALLVYLLAWKRGVSPVRLILAGVAVSGMLGALSSTILILNAEKAGGILDFAAGTLSSRGWGQLKLVAFYIPAGLTLAFLHGQKLNILALGDEVAASLGLKVEQTRFALLAIAALLAASAVCVAGLLGFVGLIAPHMVRLAIGSDNRCLLPGAALFGAVLVTACDTAGRLVMAPSELPVGVIMALLGPPFFLYLLRRHGYEA